MKAKSIRPVDVSLIIWTLMGAAGAWFGYKMIVLGCPPVEEFAGCFEPPFRRAASFFVSCWTLIEVVLIAVTLLGLRLRAGNGADTA